MGHYNFKTWQRFPAKKENYTGPSWGAMYHFLLEAPCITSFLRRHVSLPSWGVTYHFLLEAPRIISFLRGHVSLPYWGTTYHLLLEAPRITSFFYNSATVSLKTHHTNEKFFRQQLISRVLFFSKERRVLWSNSFLTDREMTILLLEPAIFR
jgi:hypothetical protein